MFNAIYNGLVEWNRDTNDRQKLQHVYVTLVFLSVVVAGIVSLIDQTTGEDILMVAMVAGAIFIINAVLWSLVESTIVARLSGKHKK